MAVGNGNVIKGSDLQVWVDGNPIAFSTSCDLSLSGDTTSIANKDFGNGWQSNVITSRSWEISCEAMYADAGYTGHATNATLFNAYKNGTEVTLVWGCTQNAGSANRVADVDKAGGWTQSGFMLTGKAIVTSLSFSGPNEDSGTMSVTFTGNGEIKTGGSNNNPNP